MSICKDCGHLKQAHTTKGRCYKAGCMCGQMAVLKDGSWVKLTDTYGESHMGTLVGDSSTNYYAVHTIILEDGSRFRTEGRLTPAQKRL